MQLTRGVERKKKGEKKGDFFPNSSSRKKSQKLSIFINHLTQQSLGRDKH